MKAKYKKGNKICDIYRLIKCEKIWVDNPSWKRHVRSIGFIYSWQMSTVLKFLNDGQLYEAVNDLENEDI